MKTIRKTKIVSFLCIIAMLFSMCSMFALAEATYSNPIVVNGSSYDNDKTPPAHDISVMSFNILQSGAGTYDKPANRLNYVMTTIQTFEPDVIGVQEASDTKVNGFTWSTSLVQRMSALGYTAVTLNNDALYNDGVRCGSTDISNGLIIFYKTDRFTATAYGRKNMVVTANYTETILGSITRPATKTDDGRWYQWVKLTDNEKNTEFYMYNTHLSVNGGADDEGWGQYDEEQAASIGEQCRTQQIKMIFDSINSVAADQPFFVTGDFNTGNNSATSDESTGQLGLLANYPYVGDSAEIADSNISAHPNGRIDHIYVNADLTKVIGHRAAQENVDGRAPSDHYALVSYNNYSPNVTFGDGEYDRVNGIFTTTSDSSSYTFDITDNTTAENLSWSISGANGNTVALNDAYNTYTINFTSGGKNLGSVKATIKYTGAATATVTASQALNSYFANDAYHVIVNNTTDSIKLNVAGGTLYNGSSSLGTAYTVNGIAGGRTEYSVSTAGHTYPLYIYKETASAASNTIYIDNNFAGETGTVAFYDGTDVILAKGQVTALSTLEAFAKKYSSSNGYTARVAAGTYEGNTTAFKANVTILGINADKPAIDGNWNLNAARGEETVILGRLYFSAPGNRTYTVKGFTFSGYWADTAAIYLSSSGSTEDQLKNTLTMDIENNIFDGYGDAYNDAAIRGNNAIQKSGIIAGNYFKYNGNEGTRDNRSIFFRNIKGLTIENNRFVNVPLPMWLTSEYTNDGASYPGWAVYTVQSNRFEACKYISNNITNIGSNTAADIKYLDNDFIRCAYFTSNYAIIDVQITDTTYKNVFENVSFTAEGNRFIGTNRSIAVRRASNKDTNAENMNDMSKMTVKINRNMFYKAHEHHSQASNLRVNLRFSFLPDSTLTPDKALSTNNWDFRYNYFESDVYNTNGDSTYGVKTDNIANPANYMNINVDKTVDSKTTTVNSFALNSAMYTPYYVDEAMTTLSNGSTPTLNITAADSTVTYDGAPHSIEVTADNYATVLYGTVNGTYDLTEAPAYTEAGKYNIYYKVSRQGYTTVTGTVKLTIQPLTDRVIAINDMVKLYTGEAYALSFTPIAGDIVTYTVNGATYSTMPAFTEIGTYDITVTVVNNNMGGGTCNAKLIIIDPSLSDVVVTGYHGFYDGKAHGVTVSGIIPDDMSISYSVNGGAYTATAPTFTSVGEYTVNVKFGGAQYTDIIRTATVTISPVMITGIEVAGYHDFYDGKAHGVTITGIIPDDMSISYSVNGGAYTATAPTFTNVGEYTVNVKFGGARYAEIIRTATVTISPVMITGVEVAGYEGIVDGAAHGLTISGTQKGDTVTYTVNGRVTTQAPTFTNEGTYVITVTISRANHVDRLFATTVILTGTDDLYDFFNLTTGEITVVDQQTKLSNLTWASELSLTADGQRFLAIGNISVISYGVKYAANINDLIDYAHDRKNGLTTLDSTDTVIEMESAENNEGLNPLYRTTNYTITNLQPLRERYAMAYIRYVVDGVVYEEYGTITAASTYLDNGLIGGIGGTEDREDILDD